MKCCFSNNTQRRYTMNGIGNNGYDEDAQAYFNAIVANGGDALSTEWKEFWDAIIINMKSSGSFQLLDRLFSFYNEHAIAARTSIVNPSTAAMATPVNAPVFTAASGYVTDGATNYIDTNFNLQTDGVNYQVFDSFWGFGSTGFIDTLGHNGVAQGITFTSIIPLFGGMPYTAMDNQGAYNNPSAKPSIDGDYIMKRNNALNYDLYYDSVLNSTQVNTATTAAAGSITIGARNNPVPPVTGFLAQTAKWTAMGASSINVAQFRTDFSTQLTGM